MGELVGRREGGNVGYAEWGLVEIEIEGEIGG